MPGRFVTIWFRHLTTDWLTLRRPALQHTPFALATPDHGRMMLTAVNAAAQAKGIVTGMTTADARALVPSLQVFDDKPGLPEKLLTALGKWCIRYTPVAAIDLPDGLVLDASGCAHLWGDEHSYLKEIITRLNTAGYNVRAAMADTIGAAWAITRFGQTTPVIAGGAQAAALLALPPAALRLSPPVLQRLQKLGLYDISSFISMPRSVLRRRFGQELLLRLDQALGHTNEIIQSIQPAEAYQERLPCLEPIRTATGIAIALQQLLEILCKKLAAKGMGLRTAVFKGYRVDGKLEQVQIGTNRASHHVAHLFKLLEEKIATIEPDLGIELFILEAPKVEEVSPQQEALWTGGCGTGSIRMAELLDRLAGKVGIQCIHRYLPAEHHWPERSFTAAASLSEKVITTWQDDIPRPIQLLAKPRPIEVTAPVPDYPPMLFRYKGKLHQIKRADGPERIEREWWHDKGLQRDYYRVEDMDGQRYWIFRSGYYGGEQPARWFIHGFFA